MLLAGAGGGVRVEAVELNFLLTNLAEAEDSVLNLIEAALHVFVTSFEGINDSGVGRKALHGIRDGILIGRRNISISWRSCFPVGRIVWINTANFAKLFLKHCFLFFQFVFEVFCIYCHGFSLARELLPGEPVN